MPTPTLKQHIEDQLTGAGWTPNASLGVAVSGGADSVALMHLVSHLSPVVLHVDHGMRPHSHLDGEFVEAQAKLLGLEFRLLKSHEATDESDSFELRSRKIRYALLEQAGLEFIATAHTLDDQAETVLMRIMRGSSLHGASGMRRARAMSTSAGKFVRPVIGTPREHLRAWLTDRGLKWIEDPTNDSLDHERNWVRKVVLPLLAERRSGVISTLARFGELAAIDDQALEQLALDRFVKCSRSAGEVVLGLDALAKPEAIAKRVVRKVLEEIGARVDRSTIERVFEASKNQTGSIDIGNGAVARGAGHGVVVCLCNATQT